MIEIDIIILSYAKTEALKTMTIETISSLFRSENKDNFNFNVVVLESKKTMSPYQYPDSRTLYPTEEFGFHKYFNMGIKVTKNELICFCNNDLIFHNGWASALLKSNQIDSDIQSFSLYCPKFHGGNKAMENEPINYGYTNGILFTGWCFLVKRAVFNSFGLFDERFKFWFCDDDFRLTLKKHGLKNALIKDAKVTHLTSETLTSESDYKKTYLKYISFALYKYKWLHHNPIIYFFEIIKYRLKILSSKLK